MSKLWYWMESPKTPMLSQNALLNLNNEENKSQDADYNHPNKEIVAEKDSMFEKPLTPSDVGKLNRLVIPKQHAERYFPIGGGGDSVEKGVLLSFEDELGKLWKFRYSYWNSSQSYVLTKGWSRFVKEKSLETGDTVVFERLRDDGSRFFIGWRRRNTVVGQAAGGWTPSAFYPGIQPYPSQYSRPNGPPLPYQPHCLHAEGATSAGVHNKRSSGNCRTVRLFGVDLECQLEEPLSGGPNQGEPHYCPTSSTTTSHVSQNHPHDINFSSAVTCKSDEG